MDIEAIIESVALPLRSQASQDGYCKAIFSAPACLDDLKAYSTYRDRIAKLGCTMVRFGVNLERWQVEVVFTTP